jgi:hypothetical protein
MMALAGQYSWITALAGRVSARFQVPANHKGLSYGSASQVRALNDEQVRQGLARGKARFRGP